MKLTTKAHYAVTAMLDLVINDSQNPVKVEDLANRHGLSLAYLERLTGRMRAKGLLISVRGPGGGYKLARSPDDITVADIIEAVEDKLDATQCQGKADCHQGMTCLAHHIWDELNHEMIKFLQTMTLSRIAKRPKIQTINNQTQMITITR